MLLLRCWRLVYFVCEVFMVEKGGDGQASLSIGGQVHANVWLVRLFLVVMSLFQLLLKTIADTN